MRVKSDAGEPFGQESRVLARCHALSWSSTREQKLIAFLARHPDIVVDGLSGLLGQFKPYGTSGFSLAYSGSIDGVAIGCNVIDLDGDNVAASKFAVDGEIEQR
jgi:hypothetical protein